MMNNSKPQRQARGSFELITQDIDERKSEMKDKSSEDGNVKLTDSEHDIWSKLMRLLLDTKAKDFKNLIDTLQLDTKVDVKKIIDSQNKLDGSTYSTCLMIEAAITSNLNIANILIESGCDINVQNEKNQNAVSRACWNNDIEMCKFLLQHGGDPNCITKNNATCLSVAASKGNKQIMKCLLNVDNNFEHSFNWDKYINLQSTNGGTAFLWCCQNGFLDCIQFLMSMQSHFKTKIDSFATSKSGMNGLTHACKNNHIDIVRYLLNDVYGGINDIKKAQQILYNQEKNRNAFYYIAYWDNVEMIEEIDKFCCGIGNNKQEAILFHKDMCNTRSDDTASTPFIIACEKNSLECVRQLITQENVNMANSHRASPLYQAIGHGNDQIVKFLCENDDFTVDITKDDLNLCVETGSTTILCLLLLGQMKQKNVSGVESLNKYGILNVDIVNEWLQKCGNKENWAMYGFLTKLKEKGLSGRNRDNQYSAFSNISRLLTMTGQTGAKNDNTDSYNLMRKDMAICNYIFNNCRKDTLHDLCAQIEKGLTKQECSFNDSLLFLFQRYDDKKFMSTLSSITNECLTMENANNIKKYSYFNNNLLNSNIWATVCSRGSDDTNTDTDEKVDGKLNNKPNKKTVFNEICENIKLSLLKQEQERLKKQLIQLEEEHRQDFDSLKNSIRKYNIGYFGSISQNTLVNRYNSNIDFMNDEENDKYGVQAEKDVNSLPVDFESGFYGSNEYDYKMYLTNVLIEAHEINPIFQNECRQFFNSLLNVSCKYTSAPVKTYDRCVNKSKLDYNNRTWPHSSHILDYIRCSVVFDDIEQFLMGFNQFYVKYNHPNGIGMYNGCIQGIVRIKNDFSQLPNNLRKNLLLSDCSYRDIKCNLLIEHNHVRMIAEVQFILKFMLDTKKKQHKIYSLLRKEDLFEQLNQLYYGTNDEKQTQEYLNLIIMNQNIKQFSLFFQTMNKNELEFVLKNKKYIDDLLLLSNFEKGKRLFELLVTHHD